MSLILTSGATRPIARPFLAPVACALLLALASASAWAAPDGIRWRSGAPNTVRPSAPSEMAEKITNWADRGETTHVVAQFAGPIDPLRRDDLAASGVALLNYLGDGAYFASVTPGANARRAATTAGLVRIDSIPPVRKLHPDLAAGVTRPWSIVEPGKSAPAKPGATEPKPNPVVAVYVLFHRDVDVDAEAETVLSRHRASIRSRIRSVNGVVAHLRAGSIPGLAAEDSVMYVEPPLPRLSPINDSNRARLGTETLNGPPYGLDGSGVSVLVYDGGQIFEHGDFGDRLTIGLSDTASISDHATHVGATIGGDGSGSSGQYRGMAPGVEIVSYGFEQEGGLSQGFLYTDPGDIEADYSEAIATYGADLSNNSIGTNTASNGYPCEWEGDYGVTGALIDAIVRGSLGDPFRIVWANGNERSSGRCGTTYVTTAPPACGKNHITVGALNSDDDSVTSFTSWGPTDDGRLKPDISGPGCEAGGDGGVTSASSSGGYTVKCGTSMASPSVAGVSALLLQQYRLSFPGEPDFRNATLKAILATTAEDVVDPGPDYQSGYGSVRAVPATDLIVDGRFLEAEVGQGETYTFLVLVDAEDTELKVTVAWDDPPGAPNVDPVLVNDLDLRVVGPDSTVHHPWTLDPANPANPAVRTERDGRNNIEQVVVDSPAPGAYRVEVEGVNVAEGPTQIFGAAASPSLVNCGSAGVLGTGKSRVSCDDDLELRVIDCDLNADDFAVETVTIGVTSGSEPSGESVLLTETAPESAAFLGSLGIATTDSPGVLQVAEGDSVVATYVDADDGAGGTNVPVIRTVTVDCTAPVVTGVATTDINPRDATVTVDLDEAARVTLHLGTACGAATDSVESPFLTANHSIRLLGLTDETTYFYHLDVVDEAGNGSTDDNGGACYTFTTPMIPDFFTEQFSAGVDLAGLSVTFTPNASVDFYGLCVDPLIGSLPTDPSGGTELGLSDDQPQSFSLTDGRSVLLYGESYDTIHVGPNGYLTFGEGDSTYSESFANHFDTPRVAALFDDLNPSVGGTVSWKQATDRVTVTWEAVPEYSTSNSNTFQIEMFFDGSIRMSWEQLDVGDAIVGLSEGLGVDPDFYESDLSAGPGCGPRPPYAESIAVETAAGTPITFDLPAGDDGLPEPASLTYRVDSLPYFGALIDVDGGVVIDSTPYDLAGGGRTVRYEPQPGYHGPDLFHFVADDGGSPPDGGSSQRASVNLAIGAAGVLHEFLVDDTDPGWGTTGAWAFGQPLGGGSHDFDPTGGATGVNVYGYDLAGDYPDGMGVEYLTSLPFDLSGVSGITLEFQRWLGIESATYDHAEVEVSVDGVTWTPIWSHTGSAVSESSWSLQSYDVSALADNQPSVTFRWVMGTTDGSVTYPGWNIDDIRILGTTPSACTGAPGEARSLRIAGDKRTLEWDVPADPGGNLPDYDTLRSATATGFDAVTCVESDSGPETTAVDEDQPDPGGLFYYLIRAENDCGDGSLGQDSGGDDRTGGECPL